MSEVQRYASGLGTLPNGEQFISGWPSEEDQIDLRKATPQDIVEAAGWAKRALQTAERFAQYLDGKPLLTSGLTLTTSSSFSGLLS